MSLWSQGYTEDGGKPITSHVLLPGHQLESLHTPCCSYCFDKDILQTIFPIFISHIVLMGETQTPLSNTACLTMGRWSPSFADSF